MKQSINLQDTFLNAARKNSTKIPNEEIVLEI